MPRIIVDESFWATALLTAQGLYQFTYDSDDGDETIKSMECLGICWGNRDGEDFLLQYAVATQVIEERDEQHVVGPDPFKQLVHVAWSGLDVGDINPLGAFHSHPWSEDEVNEGAAAGWSEEVYWTASSEDRESMSVDTIEVIVSLRPLSSVPQAEHRWAERELVISGKHDTAHVTMSGWYCDKSGQVTQVPVQLPSAARINRRIERVDAASGVSA